MNQEIKDEVLSHLIMDVAFGFEDADAIYESLINTFYDIEDFDKHWLKTEIKRRIEQHENESQSWQKPTDFEKLRDAFDQLNRNGIVALHKAGYTRQDAEGDCLAIIDELKALDISAKGYCYYHTQDLERVIGEEKLLFIGYDSYNADDELALRVAKEIVSVLEDQGLNVKWSGSLNQRIEISDVNWKKTIDGVDYSYGRVFELMKPTRTIEKTSKNKKRSKPFWKFW